MTLLSHLPALLVVVPMAVAPLVAVLPSRSRLGYVLATLTAGLTFVIAILLSQQVATQGAMAYEMGSWPVPFGIGLMVTPFSAVMALIISGGSLVSLLWGALTAKWAASTTPSFFPVGCLQAQGFWALL